MRPHQKKSLSSLKVLIFLLHGRIGLGGKHSPRTAKFDSQPRRFRAVRIHA